MKILVKISSYAPVLMQHVLDLQGLLQHCSSKGDVYHLCTEFYLNILDIKQGKTLIDKSISDGYQKRDVVEGIVDETEGHTIRIVIDRQGNDGAAVPS